MINNPSSAFNQSINKMINLNDKRFFFIDIDLIKDCINKPKKISNSESEKNEDIPIKKVRKQRKGDVSEIFSNNFSDKRINPKKDKLELLRKPQFESNYDIFFTKENERIYSKLYNKLNKNLIVVDSFGDECSFHIDKIDKNLIVYNLKKEYNKINP